MKKKIFINSFTGVFQVVINSILLFVTIPVFIKTLGMERYGLVSLLLTINGFGAIATFGFNTSLLKYLSEQGKIKESNYDITVALFVISSLIIPIAIIASHFDEIILSSIFRIQSININEDLKEFFVFILWTNVILIIGQIPTAILDSMQKIYISNGLQIIYNITSRSFMLFILLTNPTLSSIGKSIFVPTVLWFLFICYISVYQWRLISIEGLSKNIRRIVKKHFKYGTKVFATGFVGMLYEPLTKILINAFLGLHDVAFFEIALRLKGFVWSIGERFLYPIAPMLAGNNDKDQIKRYITKVEQFLFIFSWPIIIIIFFIIHDVLYIWLGENNTILAWSTAIIMSSYIMALVVMPTYLFLMVKNKPHKALYLQICNVLINAVLFFLLVPLLGYFGAVISYSLAIIVTFMISIFYNLQYFDSTILFAVKNKTKSIILIVLLTLLNILFLFFHSSNILHISITIIFNGLIIGLMFYKIEYWLEYNFTDLRKMIFTHS